jgi:hypothetical protein
MGAVSADAEGFTEHPAPSAEVEHGPGSGAEPDYSASPVPAEDPPLPEQPQSSEAAEHGSPEGLSPSDPDVLNSPNESEAAAVGESKEFGTREPWNPPEGAAPRPAEGASPDVTRDWALDRLKMHVDDAIEKYNVEGMSPGREDLAARDPGSVARSRGSTIDGSAKATIMQDPELADAVTAPDFFKDPDVFMPAETLGPGEGSPVWADITTPEQWLAHVRKYGPRLGGGALLPTR